MEKILELMEIEKKISHSFIYYAISISEYKGEKEVFKRLAYRAIDRNTSDEKVTKNLYNELNNMIGNCVCNGDACENKETFLSIIYAVSCLLKR